MLFQPSWNVYQSRFDKLLGDLACHQALLETAGDLARFEDVQAMRVSQQIAYNEREKEEEQLRLDNVREWLACTDYQMDHADQFVKDFPGRSAWLFKKHEMRAWLDPGSSVSLFWLHGIPGAGTVYITLWRSHPIFE